MVEYKTLWFEGGEGELLTVRFPGHSREAKDKESLIFHKQSRKVMDACDRGRYLQRDSHSFFLIKEE